MVSLRRWQKLTARMMPKAVSLARGRSRGRVVSVMRGGGRRDVASAIDLLEAQGETGRSCFVQPDWGRLVRRGAGEISAGARRPTWRSEPQRWRRGGVSL